MNKTKKDCNINIRLKRSDKDFLETLARLNDIPLSQLIRQLLQEQINFVKGIDNMKLDEMQEVNSDAKDFRTDM